MLRLWQTGRGFPSSARKIVDTLSSAAIIWRAWYRPACAATSCCAMSVRKISGAATPSDLLKSAKRLSESASA